MCPELVVAEMLESTQHRNVYNLFVNDREGYVAYLGKHGYSAEIANLCYQAFYNKGQDDEENGIPGLRTPDCYC